MCRSVAGVAARRLAAGLTSCSQGGAGEFVSNVQLVVFRMDLVYHLFLIPQPVTALRAGPTRTLRLPHGRVAASFVSVHWSSLGHT